MCKRKEYNVNFSQYLEEVIFGIVYASFSDFVSNYILYFKKEFPETSFRERVISQYEEQIVDIDDIATDLNLTLEDVLQEKIYVLNLNLKGYDFTVFIGRQYLVIRVKLSGKDLSDECIESLEKMLNTQSIAENIEIVDFNCRMLHSIISPSEKELGDILDMGVFTGIEADIKNSRYVDTYLYGDYHISLIRELRDVKLEDNTSAVFANILCSFSAEIKNSYSKEDIKSYINCLKQETTQCFA